MKVKIHFVLLLIQSKLGRGKKKKKLKKLIPIIAALVGKKIFAIVPLFLVGLAVLAFKALVTAKLALLLAGILTISKAFGGGGGGGGGLGGIIGKVAGSLGSLSGGLGGGSAGNYANSGSSGSGGYASSGSQAGGWSSGSGNSAYPYARSYDEAQDLAYSGHVQTE